MTQRNQFHLGIPGFILLATLLTFSCAQKRTIDEPLASQERSDTVRVAALENEATAETTKPPARARRGASRPDPAPRETLPVEARDPAASAAPGPAPATGLAEETESQGLLWNTLFGFVGLVILFLIVRAFLRKGAKADGQSSSGPPSHSKAG